MPGVDFERIRAEITMEQVLNLLGFEPLSRSGVAMVRAVPCTDCGSGRRRRSFSVNVAIGRYYCHRCHSHGNRWSSGQRQPSRAFIKRRLTSAVAWAARSPGFGAGKRIRSHHCDRTGRI